MFNFLPSSSLIIARDKTEHAGSKYHVLTHEGSPYANVRPRALLLPLPLSIITIITTTIIINIIINITRPKPAYGRQGLVGLWGQDTNQARNFLGVLNVSLRASSAQLI